MDGPANARGILGASLGDEDHVTGDVTGGLVVLSVGDLPREVRDEQSRVTDPTNGVVQLLRRREGLVTALVSQNPDTGTEETLENGVQPPQSKPQRVGRHVLGGHKVLEDIEDGGEGDHIPDHIGQTSDGGALEAVSRDSITDLLDGVVGDLKLVAIGVDHLALAILFSIRRHGRERGGRRRVTRAVQGRRRGRDVAGVGGRVAVQRNALGESGGRHGWLISG